MIKTIKKIVANSIILVFSPTNLSNLMNYWINLGEPEKTMGPSGIIPIAVLKEESNVEII